MIVVIVVFSALLTALVVAMIAIGIDSVMVVSIVCLYVAACIMLFILRHTK